MSKIWFITGSSRGFSRRSVETASSRGDKVAASARNTDSLTDLVAGHGDAILPLSLDATDKAAATGAQMHAHERFGVTQAALPYPRAQGSGHIIVLSSMLGVAAFPATGGYSTSKAAIESSPTPWPGARCSIEHSH